MLVVELTWQQQQAAITGLRNRTMTGCPYRSIIATDANFTATAMPPFATNLGGTMPYGASMRLVHVPS